MAPEKQPWRFCGIFFFNLMGEKLTMETMHGCRINDKFLVGTLITKYILIGYYMKSRGLGWKLDMSSPGDNEKNKFFLKKCS